VVFAPINLSNVIPALVIALISLAYLEDDGLLISIALLAAIITLAVAAGAVGDDPRCEMARQLLEAHRVVRLR
jgi:hypothetical protein